MTGLHWTLRALGDEELHRVRELMDGATMTPEDQRTVETAVLAHDLALSETIGQDPEESRAATGRLFDIRARLLPPRDRDELLELCCIAFAAAGMGNQTIRLKEYQLEAQMGARPETGPEPPWDQRVETTVRERWLDLLQDQGKETVPPRIQTILEEQGEWEQPFLEGIPHPDARRMAIRLMGLYHWATAARAAAHGDLENAREHLQHAENCFQAQGDHRLEMLLSRMGAMVEARERMRAVQGQRPEEQTQSDYPEPRRDGEP